jgi:hypothetical protein
LAEQEAILQGADAEIEKLGSVEVLVGIASRDNADTIGPVVRAAQNGLKKYFSSRKTAILHVDGGSQDGTVERVLASADSGIALVQTSFPVSHVYNHTNLLPGISGKGSALHTILSLAQKLEAKGCVVVEADLESMTPEWVARLIGPVLEKDYDFVAPVYARHKYEGALVSGLAYPLTRALYGKRLRQPLAGDIGLSSRAIEHFLKQEVWKSDSALAGINLWMATEALIGGLKLCQTFLGPKTHSQQDHPAELSDVLAAVAGFLFGEMEKNATVWQRVRTSEALPPSGARFEDPPEPGPANVRRMMDAYRLGHQTLRDIWNRLLPPDSLLELKRLAERPEEQFRFPDELWARIIYDFSLGYRLRTFNRDHLLRAMTPLYLAWVASMILETQESGPMQTEERLEKLCLAFEAQKPYLISRWRWPDRSGR